MKAYEFASRVTPEGKLELPADLMKVLPLDQALRVILLVREPAEVEEAAWARLTEAEFLAGYGEIDAMYDRT